MIFEQNIAREKNAVRRRSVNREMAIVVLNGFQFSFSRKRMPFSALFGGRRHNPNVVGQTEGGLFQSPNPLRLDTVIVANQDSRLFQTAPAHIYFLATITVWPPMYFCNASGIWIEPSAC